jgi:hypothetical protein
MRFLVAVDKDWNVEITVPGGAERWTRRMLREDDGARGVLPMPDPATLQPAEPRPAELSASSAAEVLKVYRRIINRQLQKGDIVDYGTYLFTCLIGPAIWRQMQEAAKQDRFVELALSWDRGDANLSRLHWEMMYCERFIAGGYTHDQVWSDVAITRVVPGAQGSAGQLSATPRILFVVGTSLTERSIRPGAEIMALLQTSEIFDRISPSVLENASPRSIQRRLETFKPDVVHFICHGHIDAYTGSGTLELSPDPPDTNKNFNATQIAQWLKASGSPPQIVVLSACQSGAALGPESVMPLAVELVAQDMPVVIAMSGRVSDMACRLFTRQFGKALIERNTLTAATAKGRRAALSSGNSPEMSPDWAFPTVYLSPQVPSDYAPAAPNAGGMFEMRLKPYSINPEPIFCGRQEFFENYRELVAKKFGVLAAYVKTDTPGYGRTRLLEALTSRAVRDGHVPCPVLARPQDKWKRPNNPLELASCIDAAMRTARESLGLPLGEDTMVTLLEDFASGQIGIERLPTQLARAVRRGSRGNPGDQPEVNPLAIETALEMQFAKLMQDARAKHPDVIGKDSRAIVLLDDADLYANSLDEIAKMSKLGSRGLGPPEEPVPVIMTFSVGTAASDYWTKTGEVQGWERLELCPFDKTEGRREDMLAYARVLMNPFDKKLLDNVSGVVWVMDYDNPDMVRKYEARYAKHLKGLPVEFRSDTFYMLADFAKEDSFLIPADADNDSLRRLDGGG